jgi:hypothetical protein
MILIFSHQNLSFVAGIPAAASGPRLDLGVLWSSQSVWILQACFLNCRDMKQKSCTYKLRIMQEKWHTCRSAAQGSELSYGIHDWLFP